MVLSWSLTEVVRYSFYACALLGSEPRALVFLRYTLFYVLYPTGASSEALLIYATLPHPAFGYLRGAGTTAGTLYTHVREALFALWWPGKCRFALGPGSAWGGRVRVAVARAELCCQGCM